MKNWFYFETFRSYPQFSSSLEAFFYDFVTNIPSAFQMIFDRIRIGLFRAQQMLNVIFF